MVADRGELEQPAHRRYFVVFLQGEPHWMDWFLAPGYGHCYLLVWDADRWIWIHPTLQIVQVTVDRLYGRLHPQIWPEHETARVIEVGLQGDERNRTPWMFGPLSCVELVKAFLGIRRFWIWTPRQLARYLERRYGQHWQDGREAWA